MRGFAPAWVYMGAVGLSGVAGFINVIAWLGPSYKGVSHVTGALTAVGGRLGLGDLELALMGGLVVGSFMMGAVISGAMVRDEALKLGRRYAPALWLEAALLCAAYTAIRGGDDHLAACLAAMACGLQNALATSFSGALLRTTHMTGIVTDLGLMLGHALRGKPLDWWQLWLFLSLIFGFVLGSTLGAASSATLQEEALLAPAVILGVGGLIYELWRRRQLQREGGSSALVSDE